MKNIIKSVIVSMVLMCAVVGCTTTQPVVSTLPSGQVVTNIVHVVDTNTIASVFGQLQAANTASAPVNPYSGLVTLGLTVLGTLITGGSMAVAAVKNNSVNTAKAATTALAANVLSAPDHATAKVAANAALTS